MKYLPKIGRLERTLSDSRVSSIPKSETVQTIELTKLPDGSILEGEEFILAEKDRKVLALKEKYGSIDEKQITWVKIKKDQTNPA
ncbi:MAG: hypothetical protein NTX06_02515 [Proteobacteria bacterium]|nr:hypothetical protein [Pseudomonadota bacterium]